MHIKPKLPLFYWGIIFTITIIYPQNFFGQANQNHLIEQKIINPSDRDSAVSAASHESINISIANNLLKGKIEQASLTEIFKRLSELSGVPIIILDPKETKSTKVSISLDGVLIQEAVKMILDQYPSGGLATEQKIGGASDTTRIYVITKKSVNKLQADVGHLLEKIKKGEKPPPQELAQWLVMLFSTFGHIDLAETSMTAVPVLSLT